MPKAMTYTYEPGAEFDPSLEALTEELALQMAGQPQTQAVEQPQHQMRKPVARSATPEPQVLSDFRQAIQELRLKGSRRSYS